MTRFPPYRNENDAKVHSATRSGRYGTMQSAEIPWLSNIRQDPFEGHLKTLTKFPPADKGSPVEVHV